MSKTFWSIRVKGYKGLFDDPREFTDSTYSYRQSVSYGESWGGSDAD